MYEVVMQEYNIGLATALLGALVGLTVLPFVLFFEHKKKSKMRRGPYIFASIVTTAALWAANIIYVQSLVHKTIDYDFFDPFIVLLIILAFGKYIFLMIAIRRLRDMGWFVLNSILILIPGLNLFIWLLFAVWPSQKRDYFEAKKIAEQKGNQLGTSQAGA